MGGGPTVTYSSIRSVTRIAVGLLVAFPVFLSLPQVARSQQEAATPRATQVIEEITVTARKREESLQDVPISITALGSDELEQRSLRNLRSLTETIPNLRIGEAGLGRSSAALFIRGMGQASNIATQDPRVGLYIDGVYQGRLQGGLPDIVDLERVEVLRGPQGTLFGKNTIGGLINLVSAKPTDELSGRLKIGFGNKNQFRTAGVVNFPILDEQLFARVSFVTNEADGYVKNTFTGGDAWMDERKQSARLALRYLPTDSITLDVTAEYQRVRESNGINTCKYAPKPPAGGAIVTPAQQASCIRSSLSSDYKGEANVPREAPVTIWGWSSTLEWDLGFATLTEISSFRATDWKEASSDSTVGSVLDFWSDSTAEQNQWSHELRLNGASERLSWVGGAYFFREDAEVPKWVILFPALLPGPPSRNQIWDVVNTSWALFGEATYDLTERLSLTGGLRRTNERKHFNRFERFGLFGPQNVAASPKGSKRYDAWTPRANLKFQINDDLMVYGGWSRGFASGGFNSGREIFPYEPEFASVWEVGFKGVFFDNRLTVNASYYDSDYDDIQLQITREINGVLQALNLNAGAATIRGAEVEVVARPIEGLTLSAGLGITDGDYTEFLDQVGVVPVDRKDAPYPGPQNISNFSAQYDFTAGSYGDASARLDWSYKSKAYDLDRAPEGTQNKVGILNGRVSLMLPDGRTEIALWGTNLLDREWEAKGDGTDQSFSGSVTYTILRPRRYGIEVSRRFGQ
jgi:iron complex outermembrane receptor protein